MAMRISGMVSGLDTDSIVSALTATQSKKVTTAQNAQTKLTWKKDAYKTLNSKLYSFYSQSLSKLRYASTFNVKKASISNESVATTTATGNAIDGTYSLSVNKLAQTGYMTGGKIEQNPPITSTSKLEDVDGLQDIVPCTIQVKTSEGVKNISITKDMTMAELASKLKESGVNANYSDTNKRFFISSKVSGANGDFEISSDDEVGNLVLNKLGLAKESGATKIDGSDAEITVNGATFISNTNDFDINGLKITAKKVDTEPTTVTIAKDTTAVYNTIKDFINEYNSIIEEFSKSYYADDTSKYTMLTDDEKESMSEKQIEDWENKIKSSLLRNDSLVNGIMTTMKETTLSSFGNYSLAKLGISTGNYLSTEKTKRSNLLIDGEDNTKTNKLMDAIENDLDGVIDYFTNMATSMYNSLDKKIGSSEYSSKFTFYNDKQMDKQYSNYSKQITTLEEKLTKMEDKYYKQYAQMETLLAQMNSQSSSLSSLFGM